MDLLPLLITVASIAVIVLVIVWYFKQYFGALFSGGAAGGAGGLGGLVSMLSSVTGNIQNGVPATATIQSIGETGMTVQTPSLGPDAAFFKLGLQVTPASGVPYNVEVTQVVPRIYRPMIVPGAEVGVMVDPADPNKVALDWSRIGASAAAAGTFAGGAGANGMATPAGFAPFGAATLMTQGGTMNTAGVNVTFDAQGNPTSGLDAMVNAVQAGTMPQIPGSAAALLATGTHGTAVITSCQPLGKKVRDVNPRAEASHLDDPMWLFTVEVTLAGRPPFASMFGHRVPIAKVGYIAPGVKLAVAVDPSNPSQDVAIDWDQSPLP